MQPLNVIDRENPVVLLLNSYKQPAEAAVVKTAAKAKVRSLAHVYDVISATEETWVFHNDCLTGNSNVDGASVRHQCKKKKQWLWRQVSVLHIVGMCVILLIFNCVTSAHTHNRDHIYLSSSIIRSMVG